jgi:hypothetical protein
MQVSSLGRVGSRCGVSAPARGLLAAAAISGAACSPVLDWRDVKAASLSAQMPCRPSVQARAVQIEGHVREMTLMSCSAGSSTWAVAWIGDVAPAEIVALTDRLRHQALANVAGQGAQAVSLAVPGATPNAASGRWRGSGRRPDGSALTQDVAVFSRGTTVFQATILSADARIPGAEQFFGALRFLA